MTPRGPARQSASYVRGNAGSRFRLVSEPPGGAPHGTVIWAHAFAEEMNKSRRMCARMARILAATGLRVVQIDLLGCGDSSGEFRDASWRAWVEDLALELRQADAAAPCWVWAVRAGALLVPELLRQRPDIGLLLWQPVLSGSQMLQQFLRLHAGARIVGQSADQAAKPTPAQLLKAGQLVEVGGYEISPALAKALEGAQFELPQEFSGNVVWLDVSAAQPPVASLPARELAQRLRERGVHLHHEVVHGPAFWQTQEIEDCDALLERSAALLANGGTA